jgi:hypothetical protein
VALSVIAEPYRITPEDLFFGKRDQFENFSVRNTPAATTPALWGLPSRMQLTLSKTLAAGEQLQVVRRGEEMKRIVSSFILPAGFCAVLHEVRTEFDTLMQKRPRGAVTRQTYLALQSCHHAKPG